MPGLTNAVPSTAISLLPLGLVSSTSYTCLPGFIFVVIVLAIDILILPSAALVIPTAIK